MYYYIKHGFVSIVHTLLCDREGYGVTICFQRHSLAMTVSSSIWSLGVQGWYRNTTAPSCNEKSVERWPL